MSDRVPVGWSLKPIGEMIRESRLELVYDDPAKRLAVRLHLQGIGKRSERATDQVGATKYFVRKSKQFVYGKQNLHKGAFGVIPDALDGFSSSQDIPAFDFEDDTNPNWFNQYFQQENFYQGLEKIASGTGSKRIQPKELYLETLLCPPLPEQKKIASILTSVDDVIETTQRQIDKLQDLKKATMNELLTKGIGHTEFKDSELGRIPKSWEVVRFGDIAKQKTLGTTERGGDDAMVPLVKMGDIQSGKVLLGSNEKVSQSKLIPQNFLSNGDFLFNTRNTPELVGKVGNFNSSKVASFDNNLLRINFFEDVLPLFMGIQFNDASFKKRLKTLVAGTTSVAAIYWNDLSRFRVVKPKIMEQTEIASIIYSIDMQIDDQGKKLSQTQALKKSLMQDLLTGKVRVQVT